MKPDGEISRVITTREQTEQSYNRMSRTYDLFAGISEKKHRNLALDRLDIKTGESVLEVGVGTGRSLARIAGLAGAEGRVCGIDLSPGMLKLAVKNLEKAGLAGRVKLVQGDALALPWENHFFDAVFMSFTLELFDTPEIPMLLERIGKVLKPGGRLGVVSLSRASGDSTMLKLYEWAHRHFPKYVDCRPIYPAESLKEAGFGIRHRERGTLSGLPVEIVVGTAI